MEDLIGDINSLIRRPATASDGDGGVNRTQAFLLAFEQIVTNGSGSGGGGGGGGATRKARCWATQNGWLLVSDPASMHPALWDPVSHDTLHLPRLPNDGLPRNCRCLLSHEKPTSHGCVLLVVDLDSPALRYCRVGHSSRWYTHEYSFENHPGFQIQSVAAVGGDFYFSVSTTELVCMELMCYEFNPEPRFTTVEHDRIWLAGGFPIEEASQDLVESRGKLFMFIQYYPLRVGGYQRHGVWAMDFMKRQWGIVYQLGDQVLLVGPSRFAASLPAGEVGVEDSCVYSIRDDRVMNIHSLRLSVCFRFPYPHNLDMSGAYTLASNACGFDVVG